MAVFCAEPSYLGVMLSKNHTRISQMFGRGNHDLKRLTAFASGLEEKRTSGRSDLCSLSAVETCRAFHPRTARCSKSAVKRGLLRHRTFLTGDAVSKVECPGFLRVQKLLKDSLWIGRAGGACSVAFPLYLKVQIANPAKEFISWGLDSS